MSAQKLRNTIHAAITRFWAWVVFPEPEENLSLELRLEGGRAPITVVIPNEKRSLLVMQLLCGGTSPVTVKDETGSTHVIMPRQVTHFRFK
jgi:hypothetical protein